METRGSFNVGKKFKYQGGGKKNEGNIKKGLYSRIRTNLSSPKKTVTVTDAIVHKDRDKCTHVRTYACMYVPIWFYF